MYYFVSALCIFYEPPLTWEQQITSCLIVYVVIDVLHETEPVDALVVVAVVCQ